MIKKDGLIFVRLYFLNYTWYVNDLYTCKITTATGWQPNCSLLLLLLLLLIVFILSFQNYNNMEFGIVRLIGIFVVGKLALTVGLVI